MLYRGDREPVVAIVGATPMWRALGIGSPNGDDVHQLEVALAALGHGDGLTVDDDFTAATAVAVQRWEQSLGRANPDGTVALGDVVAVSVDTSVSGLAARPGDRLRRGAPVLRLAEPTRRVVLDVVQGETGPWSPGTEVALEWDDGTSAIGRVDTVGRDAATGDDGRETVEVTVALAAEDTVHAIGTPARATVTAAIARAAVAVPVAAVAEGADGKPAVRVPAGERDDSVPVTLGFVADGWVAVTGIDEGTKVRLPG